jgi:hypothetical protein
MRGQQGDRRYEDLIIYHGLISAESATSDASSPVMSASAAGDSTVGLSAQSSHDIRVKVIMYFQMPFAAGVEQEEFIVPNPARFSDLLASVLEKHPALSPMMPTVMVLTDRLRPSSPRPLERRG